MSKVQIFF